MPRPLNHIKKSKQYLNGRAQKRKANAVAEQVQDHQQNQEHKQGQDQDQESESSDEAPFDPQLRWKRHFFYHEEGQREKYEIAQWELDGCHWCQINSFPNARKYPIWITNQVDDINLPDNFKFINKSVLHPKVELPEDGFRSGCSCTRTRDCKYAGCHCLQDMDFDEDEAIATGQKVYSYHSLGDRSECLRGSKLHSRDPIYECHASCECDETCANRVVERGRKIPLNIFRTDDNRGWGVRSSVNIKKGQFIDLYLGHIIPAGLANQRRARSQVAQRKDVYLFALDKFSDPNSEDIRLRQDPYEVDGEFMSGPTRFINHSCDPNLRIFARVGDHADKHIHDLAFFATQDIDSMTELTFDYVDGGDTDLVEDSNNYQKVKDMTKCLCGSDNCRGYLW